LQKEISMRKVILILVVLFSFTTVFTGCKEKGCTDPVSINYDEDAEDDDGSCTYGGSGGSIKIEANVKHHNTPIFSTASYRDTAYLKFNAVEFPGTSPSAYDMIVIGDDGEAHVDLEGIKSGKYFLYMTGWDPAISMRVSGGIPIVITQTTGEFEVDVPVVE
jgi:hypothetical protein